MILKTTKNEWSVGDLVTLNWTRTHLIKEGKMSYSYMIDSSYFCIREATESQRGILIKSLDKTKQNNIMLVKGKPFCKDDFDDMFLNKHYFSFSFPMADELKEVLDILRSDIDIQQKLLDNNMVINPNGTFWVNDTKSQFLGLKRKLQYYDSSTDSLVTANSQSERHQRITIVYFGWQTDYAYDNKKAESSSRNYDTDTEINKDELPSHYGTKARLSGMMYPVPININNIQK